MFDTRESGSGPGSLSLATPLVGAGPLIQPKPCPLAAVEARLGDALHRWKESEREYFTPNLFRLNLNDCIQALRSVTFVLQKNRKVISDFERWYEGWQHRLRSDSTMQWLVGARNAVVKEGDLQTHSKARLTLLLSWNSPPVLDIDVPPDMTPSECLRLASSRLQERPEADVCVLQLEKRWVEVNLPGVELLEALAYAFGTLTELTVDAHGHLREHSQSDCPWLARARTEPSSRPPCMVRHDLNRTAYFDIKTGTPRRMEPASDDVSRFSVSELNERYPGIEQVGATFRAKDDTKSQTLAWVDAAKLMLARDGYHQTIALLRTPTGLRVHGLAMRDRADKHILFRNLAAEVERHNAVSVIVIGEVWTAEQEPSAQYRHAVDAPNRGEGLQVIGCHRSGEVHVFLIPFCRRGGQIEFGECLDMPPDGANIVKPIVEALAKLNAGRDKPL